MATKKSKKRIQEILEHSPKQKNDVIALLQHVRENPVLYATSTLFVLLAALAGLLYRVSAATKERTALTEYARALKSEDPKLRTTALEQVPASKGKLAAEVLYMTGEAAYQEGDYEKAKAAFERARNEYPDSPYAPDAMEGLGYIAENQEKYEDALALYKGIQEKWPASFTARRQSMNSARCQEHLGRLPEAVESYRQQVDAFPGSHLAQDAQAALDRLRKDHPDLFPEPAQSELPTGDVLKSLEGAATQTPTAPVSAPEEIAPSPETDATAEGATPASQSGKEGAAGVSSAPQ
ncbi:MAG: tetratricopeptide repeat protein [Candidatus Hydrogenedentes bacterium]|nr:tetratricopeptide repeat protein [Candidatus Hydrogenedentota bacterium]